MYSFRCQKDLRNINTGRERARVQCLTKYENYYVNTGFNNFLSASCLDVIVLRNNITAKQHIPLPYSRKTSAIVRRRVSSYSYFYPSPHMQRSLRVNCKQFEQTPSDGTSRLVDSRKQAHLCVHNVYYYYYWIIYVKLHCFYILFYFIRGHVVIGLPVDTLHELLIYFNIILTWLCKFPFAVEFHHINQ
jgi:hypothetical protein